MKCKCGCGKQIQESYYYYSPTKSWRKKEFAMGHRLSPKLKNVPCSFCGNPIKRRFCKSLQRLKHNFCSRKCFYSYRKQNNSYACTQCKKDFNPNRRGLKYKKQQNKFCSLTCFYSFNTKENHPNYKTGREKTTNGYIVLYKKSHSTNNRGRILEHRYLMEKHINRKLRKNELVHHIDGNKENNSIDNLKIVTYKEHLNIHGKERRKNNLKTHSN